MDQCGFRNYYHAGNSDASTWSNNSSYYSQQYEYSKWNQEYSQCGQFGPQTLSTIIKHEYDNVYPTSCNENLNQCNYDEEMKYAEQYPSSTSSLAQLQMLTNQHCSTLESTVQKSVPKSKNKIESKSKSTDKSGTDQVTRKATLRPHSTPATLMWLEDNYELADGVCIPRSVLYLHYVDFCNKNHVQPVNAASFGKIIRQQFPHLTTRRLGTRGQSRYHYYGIAIKECSPYYQLSYSKKSVQIQSNTDHRKYKSQCSGQQTKMEPNKYCKVLDKTKSDMDTLHLQNMPNADAGMQFKASWEHTSKTYRTLKESKPGSNLVEIKLNEMFNGEAQFEMKRNTSATGSGVNGSVPGLLFNTFVPVLPPFPTMEELQLCRNSQNNLVSTFLLMYRAHCQRILDAIVRANFDEVHTLVYHFWQQIPHHLIPVMNSNLLINLLAICDIRLYRTIIKLISVTLTQPLPEVVHNQLEDFANRYETILTSALQQENLQLKQIKVDIGKQFIDLIKCLLRHCRQYHTMQNEIHSCPTVMKQLYIDWSRLDIDTLCTGVMEHCAKCLPNMANHCKLSLHKLLYKYLTDLKTQLANLTDCCQLFEWFEHIWLTTLQTFRNERLESIKTEINLSIDFVRSFLSIWTLTRCHIVKCFAKQRNYSKDLFLRLSGLFEEFCIYKVKDFYLDNCMQVLFTNARKNSKPVLPQFVEPCEWMKHVTTFGASECGGYWTSTAYDTCADDNNSYNCYQEFPQTVEVYGNGYPNNEYETTTGSEPPPVQQPRQRQDSLICFSMNFHANSIQVMAAPPNGTSTNQTEMTNNNNNNNNGSSSNEHYRHYYSQATNTYGTSNGSGSKSICCYLSDTCQNSCYNL